MRVCVICVYEFMCMSMRNLFVCDSRNDAWHEACAALCDVCVCVYKFMHMCMSNSV